MSQNFIKWTCGQCLDTGLIWTESGFLTQCVNTGFHPIHGRAQPLVRAAAFVNTFAGPRSRESLRLAQLLTHATTDAPMRRVDLLAFAFNVFDIATNHELRKFHEDIEELRKEWLLPIGSRKSEPCGYWMIADLDDFKAWVERAKAAPITQLTTIHRVAKRNFPHFAEQLEFEFWNDVAPVRNVDEDFEFAKRHTE
ncbi:MAG: hypothetical protein IPN69_08095 [Acidobacteria bacterium]|nr:hypothetical protein [Acidobacteriota bacterium]